jgi:hypothetical protein
MLTAALVCHTSCLSGVVESSAQQWQKSLVTDCPTASQCPLLPDFAALAYVPVLSAWLVTGRSTYIPLDLAESLKAEQCRLKPGEWMEHMFTALPNSVTREALHCRTLVLTSQSPNDMTFYQSTHHTIDPTAEAQSHLILACCWVLFRSVAMLATSSRHNSLYTTCCRCTDRR